MNSTRQSDAVVWLTLILSLACLLFTGCTPQSEATRDCLSDGGCFSGEICFNGWCHTRCATAANCNSDYTCLSGVCLPLYEVDAFLDSGFGTDVQQCCDGSAGSAGPTGQQGESGATGERETGLSGSTGPSGATGQNGDIDCWGKVKPEIESYRYNSTRYGGYNITLFPGSSHSVEELEFELMAVDGTATQKPYPNHNQFYFTTAQPFWGVSLTFTAIVSDKCQQGLFTFTIDFPPTVADIDGNVYHYVRICSRDWMVENLNVTRYSNGAAIPKVENGATWHDLRTGAYCNYDNDPTKAGTYGRLYNWYAANSSLNICPTGWHVPSDAQWTTLSTCLGQYNGGKMKQTGTIEAGTGLWHDPNTGATNDSGFTALPGGFRDETEAGVFNNIGLFGYWWSLTVQTSDDVWVRDLYFYSADIAKFAFWKWSGMSVRCIGDQIE